MDKLYNGKKIDINFSEIINILNINGIKYWICHGTLFGLIRDKQLIPWDHDIDIAVWFGAISREKIKKMNFRILYKKLGINLSKSPNDNPHLCRIVFSKII